MKLGTLLDLFRQHTKLYSKYYTLNARLWTQIQSISRYSRRGVRGTIDLSII